MRLARVREAGYGGKWQVFGRIGAERLRKLSVGGSIQREGKEIG